MHANGLPRALTGPELIRLALARRSLGALWRALLIWVGIRRTTPGPGELVPPPVTFEANRLDTGGAWRPKHRMQDPAKDPAEPFGGESSSRGNDHGWSGCTMTSGADAFAYQAHYQGHDDAPWGGDLRHSQGDMDGGTDLYDLRDAWAKQGQTLTIRSGQGWGQVKTDHADGRAIVIQGTGNVPGSATFDGGHACSIGPETNSDGKWLWGDPLVSDWQWVNVSAIEDWAKAWSSGVSFAVSRKPPSEPPPPDPAPDPAPPPVDTTPYDAGDLQAAHQQGVQDGWVAAGDAGVTSWVTWLRTPAPTAADRWDAGSWADHDDPDVVLAKIMADPCDPTVPASWARGPVPQPVADAFACLTNPSAWNSSGWRQTVWAG